MWRTPTLPFGATAPLLQRLPCTLNPFTKTPGCNTNIRGAFWKYFQITVGPTVLASGPPPSPPSSSTTLPGKFSYL